MLSTQQYQHYVSKPGDIISAFVNSVGVAVTSLSGCSLEVYDISPISTLGNNIISLEMQ